MPNHILGSVNLAYFTRLLDTEPQTDQHSWSSSRHTFACFAGDSVAQRRGASPMNGSLLDELDRLCGQFALALHNTELQVYTVLTLLLVLGILLFPPRNDPDQA